ncbi:MAG: NTP transferase domain-containing protein [Isosphaeraceae bacterium]
MQGPVAIILAAGHGKRMKSDKAKVLHEVCGRPMIHYVVEAARGAGASSIVVVVGYNADQVREALAAEPDVVFATQHAQLGTGDAVRSCQDLLRGYEGPALVLVGDEPLIRAEPLADLLARQKGDGAACLLGTARVPDPTGFGRILRDSAGRFLRIVEERDCSPEEKAIREINPSCYVFDLPGLWDALDQLTTSNAQGEYYLTDAPALLQSMGRKVLALNVLHHDDILGVNTRQHLAEANEIMQRRIQNHWMTEGVSIVDPRNTYIDSRAEIGRDTVVYPFTVIQGPARIGKNCRVGPFCHVRPGTTLADTVEVGAFVEVSRTEMATGARARHFAYLGDAQVGPGANIGAGVVTANFNGREKSTTVIGQDAMIGSGAVLVAPVEIGARAVVGANSLVPRNQDVPGVRPSSACRPGHSTRPVKPGALATSQERPDEHAGPLDSPAAVRGSADRRTRYGARRASPRLDGTVCGWPTTEPPSSSTSAGSPHAQHMLSVPQVSLLIMDREEPSSVAQARLVPRSGRGTPRWPRSPGYGADRSAYLARFPPPATSSSSRTFTPDQGDVGPGRGRIRPGRDARCRRLSEGRPRSAVIRWPIRPG